MSLAPSKIAAVEAADPGGFVAKEKTSQRGMGAFLHVGWTRPLPRLMRAVTALLCLAPAVPWSHPYDTVALVEGLRSGLSVLEPPGIKVAESQPWSGADWAVASRFDHLRGTVLVLLLG